MELEQKVGQMIMVGFDGPEPDHVASLITDLHLGGVILFTRNIESREQMKNLTSSLQKSASDAGDAPLLISIDQEGGSTIRIGPQICPKFLTNRNHGEHYHKTHDHSPVIEQARLTALSFIDLGINMNLAPVVDVVTVDKNEVIGDRSYGSNHEIVSFLGSEYITELQKNSVIATAKHFPGHGPTHVDSHLALPMTSITRVEAEEVHLSPFQTAIDVGVSAIMTAHMVYECFDILPAVLSHEILTRQLRKRMGFDGVIITDDLNMHAIADNYRIEESIVMAVNAGVDILLVCDNEKIQRQSRDAILEGVSSNQIPVEVIDRAYDRIIAMKRKYGLT